VVCSLGFVPAGCRWLPRRAQAHRLTRTPSGARERGEALKRLAVLEALVTVAFSVVFTGSPAHATFPGKNGRISFRRYLNKAHSRGAIFSVRPDGTGERQITCPKPGVNDFEQDWSPNGRWIAFQRQGGPRHGEGDLFKSGANGTHRTYLSGTCTGRCAADFSPFWSPSGKRISFSRWISTSPPSGNCCFTAVFIMHADGTHVRQVTQGGASKHHYSGLEDYNPVWSPDGDRFAFERYSAKRDKHAIFTVHLDGTHLHRITPWWLDGAEPDWSPNGRWIFFRSKKECDNCGNIWLVHPGGRGLRAVTHTPAGKGKWFSGSFSPNGLRITAAKAPGQGSAGNADVYIMHLDGSHRRNLTKSSPWESYPDWGPRPT